MPLLCLRLELVFVDSTPNDLHHLTDVDNNGSDLQKRLHKLNGI
jgi:hypothetical protein